MKTLLLIPVFLIGTLFGNANTDWVDKQVQAIKPPRKGVSHTAINRIKNPFIIVYKKTESDQASKTKEQSTQTSKKSSTTGPLKLSAVMNNSALINGTWYQVNDKVRGYKLAKIETDTVLLQAGRTKKMLFITTQNPKIKIQIK